jgi:hypothetical protein
VDVRDTCSLTTNVLEIPFMKQIGLILGDATRHGLTPNG